LFSTEVTDRICNEVQSAASLSRRFLMMATRTTATHIWDFTALSDVPQKFLMRRST